MDEEVDKFSETLPIKEILINPNYFQNYYEFCQKERNAEALDFYKNVNIYETLEKEEELIEFAKKLYDTYIDENAVESLNINSTKREEVKKQLQNPPHNLFESIKEEVEILTLDPYRRFFKTKIYEQMVVQHEIENKLKISQNEENKMYVITPGIGSFFIFILLNLKALRALGQIVKKEVLVNDAFEALEYCSQKKIILEGKAKKKGGYYHDFKITNKGKLYFFDIIKNTCEFHDLSTANFKFTRIVVGFLNFVLKYIFQNEKEPFTLQLGYDTIITFDRAQTYKKFIKILKNLKHEEISPSFTSFTSRLEGVGKKLKKKKFIIFSRN